MEKTFYWVHASDAQGSGYMHFRTYQEAERHAGHTSANINEAAFDTGTQAENIEWFEAVIGRGGRCTDRESQEWRAPK